MSSVSPTDGGYQYYQRTIGELEDDLKNEADRNRKSEENRLAELEENYKATLREKDVETEETIKNIKENLNKTLENERELNRSEVNRIKGETYDKFGRFQGNEADVLKSQFTNAQAAWDDQRRSDERKLQDTEQIYQRRLDEVQKESSAQLEKVAAESRESANEAYRNSTQEGKQAYQEYLNDIKAKYKNLVEQKMEEGNTSRREYDKALFDTKLDLNRQLQRQNHNNDFRLEQQQQAHSDALENAVRLTTDAGDEQNRALRGQVRNLVAKDNDYAKEKASGTSDAIREFERDWYKREKMMQGGYEEMLSNQKRQAKQSEEHAATVMNQALQDRDLKNANLVNTLESEHHANQKGLMNQFQQEREQNELRLRKEKEMSSQRNESLARDLNEKTAKSLEEQARAFNKAFSQMHESQEDKIKLLEKQLNYLNSSGDAASISPAAEANMRKALLKEYEKAYAAEREAHQGNLESVQRNLTNRLHDSASEAEGKLTKLERNNAAERHSERSNLLQHIDDTEFTKQASLRNQESDHRREVENLNRDFSLFMERQRRQSDEILDNTKNDLYAKMQAIRQEAEFSERVTQREFALRLNEQARDYEKKLMDQKADFGLHLHEVKAEADKNLRDKDRQQKLELEELSRSFEQRVTQQEIQHKERERAAQQSFQDELDKVRRSNAALLSRRS